MATISKEEFKKIAVTIFCGDQGLDCSDCIFNIDSCLPDEDDCQYMAEDITFELINHLLSLPSDTITTEDVRAAIEKLNHQEDGK